MRSIAVLLVASLVLISACATNGPKSDTDRFVKFIKSEKLVPTNKIYSFALKGWSYLDHQHLILDIRINESYLISLKQECPDLAYAQEIRFTSTVRSLFARTDAVIPVPSHSLPCRIDSIYPLSKDQTKALRLIK